MAASYPTSAKSFSSKSTTDVVEAAHVNDIQDEVTAIETALIGTLAHDVKVASGKYLFADGRSAGEGVWTAIAHSAGNFTGSGSMTWTVESGDQTTFAYTLIGDTLIVRFELVTTTVAGTPAGALQIAIPASLASTRAGMVGTIWYSDNGTDGSGYAYCAAAGTVIQLFKQDDSQNWTAATNATTVRGIVTIEVS